LTFILLYFIDEKKNTTTTTAVVRLPENQTQRRVIDTALIQTTNVEERSKIVFYDHVELVNFGQLAFVPIFMQE
jgi:hypothetical protein